MKYRHDFKTRAKTFLSVTIMTVPFKDEIDNEHPIKDEFILIGIIPLFRSVLTPNALCR